MDTERRLRVHALGRRAGAWAAQIAEQRELGAAMVVRVERESSGNAISREVVAGLAASVREAEAADGLAAFVITGRGRKFFAAGGDLKQYREIRTRGDLSTAAAFVEKWRPRFKGR